MDVKQEVLTILEENRGQSINGAKLAAKIHVTRSAIWKAVKALQNEGYKIEAVTNKGYLLLPDNDIVSSESIKPFLKGAATDFDIEVHKRVTSTNTLAKERAVQGAREGTVIIAYEQTEGRGRMGRSFYSPGLSGIYFSVILRPKLNLEDSLMITTATAVAVAKAIEAIALVPAEIKWVNDIFVNEKKVCGILTEASINFENGGLEYAVIGIGINISTYSFPDEIKKTAGSIFLDKPTDAPVSSLLVAEVLNNLSECMDTLTDKKYLDEYIKRSFLIGRQINVIKGNKILAAKALGIDDKARLIVEYEDGSNEVLSSGEVSVRLN